jgi:AraC-like DNA-binding protein
LSQHLHHDYSYLSNLFSEVEGITIEQYIINQKIEKVKELLMYDEQSLTEISIKLGYSSVAHLSNQFKKVTGLTPGYFKKAGQSKRKSIDRI